ncbi:hypothetical protein PRIPAC_84082, partial [Pristionchus pacificus]
FPPVMPVSLTSSDGRSFIVDLNIVKHSGTIQGLIENLDESSLSEHPIPLMNVTGDILEKVIEWLTHHENDDVVVETDERSEGTSRSIAQWDEDFMKRLDITGHCDMLKAADYLDIKNLMDTCVDLIGASLKDKDSEQLRAHFGIV